MSSTRYIVVNEAGAIMCDGSAPSLYVGFPQWDAPARTFYLTDDDGSAFFEGLTISEVDSEGYYWLNLDGQRQPSWRMILAEIVPEPAS